MAEIAVIGGSGLYKLPDLEVSGREVVRTPFGDPSTAILRGVLAGQEVVFLPRHGYGHTIAPHNINYRANIWALHELGVRTIFAVNAVGGIRQDLATEHLVVPDQILDYTYNRSHTFFDSGPDSPPVHIDFSEPYSARVRQAYLQGAGEVGIKVHNGGAYAATQGPRFETRAEINRLERDGADIVGMTGMPEAALAREISIDYATLSAVINPAAGRGNGPIEVAELEVVLQRCVGRVKKVLVAAILSLSS